jgi:site-specific DNA-cytosine methylase
MKVVSLFDGMSCGLVALKRAGIPATEYHAFEIDKAAIAVSKKNHPEIIHHGSVEGFDFTSLGGCDLLLGGSPCQGFSTLGRQEGLRDDRSKLFYEYLRAKDELKPTFFLLENTRMKKEWLQLTTKLIGVEPISMNSKLVSAAMRPRYYWFNWDAPQPEDRGLTFGDIWQREITQPNSERWHVWWGKFHEYLSKKGFRRALKPTDKVLCLTTSDPTSYAPAEGEGKWRNLTPIEYERCQTLPDNYTEGVSNKQRRKMLGNGWTVDVIKHLLEHMK